MNAPMLRVLVILHAISGARLRCAAKTNPQVPNPGLSFTPVQVHTAERQARVENFHGPHDVEPLKMIRPVLSKMGGFCMQSS